MLKALALGARAVLIGRPLLWGLAVDGEAGVWAVLQMLRDELEMAMGLCGRPTTASIDRSLLGTVSPLLSALKQKFPGVHLKAWTMVEVDWIAKVGRRGDAMDGKLRRGQRTRQPEETPRPAFQ